MISSSEPVPEDGMDQKEMLRRCRARDRANGIGCSQFCVLLDVIVNSCCPQMRAFKKADLEVERESSAYTAVPAHSLKSIAASAKRFLDRGVNRTSASTQKLAGVTTLPRSPPDAGPVGRDVVLDGLRLELDTYLYEPRMDPFKKDPESDDRVVFCDPLQYWMVRTSPHPNL